jgi:hypothetical protein
MITPELAREEFESGIRRFEKLLLDRTDSLLIVLKGHLLIEEQLQKIIEAAVRNPKLIRDARLTFSQRLKLMIPA